MKIARSSIAPGPISTGPLSKGIALALLLVLAAGCHVDSRDTKIADAAVDAIHDHPTEIHSLDLPDDLQGDVRLAPEDLRLHGSTVSKATPPTEANTAWVIKVELDHAQNKLSDADELTQAAIGDSCWVLDFYLDNRKLPDTDDVAQWQWTELAASLVGNSPETEALDLIHDWKDFLSSHSKGDAEKILEGASLSCRSHEFLTSLSG